jgi:WD40 repeat protein
MLHSALNNAIKLDKPQPQHTPEPGSSTGASPVQLSNKSAKAIRVYGLVACLHKHYKDQIKKQQQTPTLTALENYYIEQQYSLDINGTAPKNMAVHIAAWLSKPAPPTLLILGEAGGGKSLLTQDWEQRLWATLKPELHFVLPEQSREEYVRSQQLVSALLYHQQQWWLSYQQDEKIKLIKTCDLASYPFVELLHHQSYESLQMDAKQRKKITQGIQYYWLCQKKSYLPIRIPLGEYSEETVLNCVEIHLETVFRHECLEFEQNDLFALRKAVRFLCLFDGFDEIKSTEDQFEQNLYRSNGLQHNKTKVLFTCRSQHFDNLRRSNLCFNSGSTEIAPKVYLTQFKLTHIQAYIELYATVNNLENKTAILTSLTEHPALKELLATPLLLNLYMKSYTPDKQPRNQWELYQKLMQGLFERQSLKSNSSDDLKLEYEDASAELAFTLYIQNLEVIAKPIQYSQRRQRRRANSAQTETPLAIFFSEEPISTQLRCGHPFKLRATGEYGFIHESFKEFFMAKYLFADLADAIDVTVGYSVESAQDAWNAKLLRKKPVILRFLREAIEAQSTEAQYTLKVQLWSWVTLKTEKYSNCSANSATLLVQLRESFSKKDLSGTHLVGANLSGGMFDGTNFTEANCRGVNFTQAWLQQSNFTNACLTASEWGENPSFKLRGTVGAFFSSLNSIEQAATTDGNNICLWDGATGKQLKTLVEHTDLVRFLCYSPDGTQLASGSQDYLIGLWDVNSGRLEKMLKGHTSSVACLSYSADGRQLASGGCDNTVRLWNVASGCIEKTFEMPSTVQCLSYRADGQQLACGLSDNTLQLCNVSSGNIDATLEGHPGAFVFCIGYRPDGAQLASGGSDHVLRLWNVASGQAEKVLKGHINWVNCLSYSPDGSQLASGSEDHSLRLWNVSDGQVEATLRGHTLPICCLSYFKNGIYLASGGEDSMLRLWNASGRCSEGTLGHAGDVMSLSCKADGTQLASSDWDGKIILWDVKTGRAEAVLLGHTDRVNCLSYSADGRQLASGGWDKTVRLWNTSSGCLEATLKRHTDWVNCLSYHPNKTELASGGRDYTIRLWSTGSGQMEAILDASACSLSYSPDGSQLASGSSDGTIRLWDVERRQEETILKGHDNTVLHLSYSPDGARLASGGSDDYTVGLWNAASGQAEKIFEGHTGSISCLSYRSDGAQIVSGSFDCTLRLWDVAGKCAEATLAGHTGSVLQLSYNPRGTQLASSSDDRTLRIWDYNKYECLRVLTMPLPILMINKLVWGCDALALGCGKEVVYMQTPQGSSPESWSVKWRAALNPTLCCSDMQLAGAVLDEVTERLLIQYGAVDDSDNSVTSMASAASSSAQSNPTFS